MLIGGNIEDIDIFQTPLSRASGKGESHSTWGMDLFATMLAQVLDGRRLSPMSNGMLWAMAAAVVAAGGFTAGLNRRALVSGSVLVGQLVLLAGLPFCPGLSRRRNLWAARVWLAGRLVPGIPGGQRGRPCAQFRTTPLCPRARWANICRAISPRG